MSWFRYVDCLALLLVIKLNLGECAYILKYMEFTNRGSGKEPWSFRQTAVYHRYKPPKYKNCSTWILVGASSRAEVRLDRYTRSIPNIQDANPFEIHLIFVDTVLTSWRPYIADLTKDIQQQVRQIFFV
jgi:hypothetical protein